MLSVPCFARHPRMPLSERAAQFGAFAALTGHADAVRRTAECYAAREDYERDQSGEPLPDWELPEDTEPLEE